MKFIRDHQVQSIVGLGCSDFAVGRQSVEGISALYTCIDVVPELSERHKSTVQHPRVSFQCADITNDALAAADLCLVRQVLQHLSNGDIMKVVCKSAKVLSDTDFRRCSGSSEVVKSR